MFRGFCLVLAALRDAIGTELPRQFVHVGGASQNTQTPKSVFLLLWLVLNTLRPKP